MQLIVGVVAIPLMILNLVGGFAAVVWLAILGEWLGFIIWLAVMVAAKYIFYSLLLPARLITATAMPLLGKVGILKILGFVIGMVSVLWTFMVMSGWEFYIVTTVTGKANSDTWLPYLLLAYAVATRPWAYMASMDDDVHSAVAVIFLQIACAAHIVMIGFTTITPPAVFLTFAGIMFVGYLQFMITGGIVFILEMKQQRATTDYAEV